MKIDQYGQVELSADEIFAAIYRRSTLFQDPIILDNNQEASQYNQAVEENADNFLKVQIINHLDLSIEDFDKSLQKNWFIPDQYKTFDIEQWLFEQCQSNEEKERVNLEISLFKQHNMIDALIYFKYLVDLMRENKIVWGVGRGSSVASYCLFLIGIHKINSIKYEIEIKEFLK